MTAIDLSKVGKKIAGQQVLSDVSLRVGEGRVFALLGPNGAGKTTLVRIIGGLLRADAGTVCVFNQELTAANCDALRSRMGFQNDGNLYEDLTVEENLRLWGELYGMDAASLSAEIASLAAMFGFADRLSSKAGELSKGNRQKILVARAVLHHPELLVLDEPTSGLDLKVTEILIGYLEHLVRERGTTIVLCTHLLAGIDGFIDDVAFIDHGEIVESGDVASLMKEAWPNDEYSIVVEDAALGMNVCARFGDVHLEGVADRGKRLRISRPRASLSIVLRELALHDIPVIEARHADHTIKDLYSRVLLEGAE